MRLLIEWKRDTSTVLHMLRSQLARSKTELKKFLIKKFLHEVVSQRWLTGDLEGNRMKDPKVQKYLFCIFRNSFVWKVTQIFPSFR